MELGEKLATFDIETDTDVSSVYPTDTGRYHGAVFITTHFFTHTTFVAIGAARLLYWVGHTAPFLIALFPSSPLPFSVIFPFFPYLCITPPPSLDPTP